MKILGVIPARGGSKGLERKNIKLLSGKPLIAFSIEAALKSNLTKTIVSTDDDEISSVAIKWGANVPFKRSEELSTDTAKSIPVAINALQIMDKMDKTNYNAIMLLQPTTPFRTYEDINNAIELLENNDCDSVISVTDVEGYHPARMKYIEKGILIDPPFCEKYENQARQELKPIYIRNGAIYLTRREILLNNSYKGEKSQALVMPKERSINIDNLFDFELAEWLYTKNKF